MRADVRVLFGGCWVGDSGTIAGSGGIKVDNGVNVLLLIEFHCSLFLRVIGGVELSTSGDALIFAPFVVCSSKESFETSPSFLMYSETFPVFSVINKDTSLINKLEGDADYFFEVVGSVASSGIVAAILDPVE